ncbi:hypothetical protein CAPTEDRAFT_17698 [Capitella teleta]|uniref:F5/8 type C domain-containing protein n=1 Tax=Capitella teleta TaxID=283909 RepID=X1ZEA8_CAPTE|nr:hypothetical protein CAPTEDRAFT_17698 [Capitella teleta]|eukprot:ELT90101.1 hypothetical protein CAPTEDRAFT_17698 [Capitella teleta]
MFDVALSAAGAQISFATSCDENFPPEHIIDGKDDTFWSSTGLFPQEFVVTFASLMNINTIKIECSNVRKLLIERSVQNEPDDFEPVEQKDMENSDGQWQSEEISVSNMTAVHLKFTVMAAYDHFVAVHRLHVDGNAVHG